MQRQVWASYFSPTGTTGKVVRFIADDLARRQGGTARVFDFTLPGARREAKAFSADDLVVFGVPVYAGRVPNLLLKYLNTLEGSGAWAVPIVLFGNRNYDDALIELRNLLQERGFTTVAGAAFVGEHSFSRILAAGRPDAADMALAARFAEGLYTKLTSGQPFETPAPVGGCDPIRPYYQPRDRAGNPVSILKVKPKTSDACTRCGICAAVCPMGAIDPDDVTQVPGICIKCGACSKKCPVDAKYYDDPGYLYHKEELELEYARRAEPALFL